MNVDEIASRVLESPLEAVGGLTSELGVELWIKRDDLLPFPLAGNKVRKLTAEANEARWASGDVLISNGGIDSNHCRTLALMAARIGARAHLVLHGEMGAGEAIALRVLDSLGATYDIVGSAAIASTISRRRSEYEDAGSVVKVVAGGAHTPAGVRAYVTAGHAVLRLITPAHVVVASGTGATHAGLHLAARGAGAETQVTGISVARQQDRGLAAVREAVSWIDNFAAGSVRFDARFIDGGYGQATEATERVVSWAWRHGLPLDATYTGKAMRGLVELIRDGTIRKGERVLFWHTGGLMNHLVTIDKCPAAPA